MPALTGVDNDQICIPNLKVLEIKVMSWFADWIGDPTTTIRYIQYIIREMLDMRAREPGVLPLEHVSISKRLVGEDDLWLRARVDKLTLMD